MTMNPLPPQAYTKETLLRAYHWLQNQPGSIKEMALTPDILVSLYLKASRDGDHALERPSIQNFKTELKNLAGMMGELEPPMTTPEPSPFFATPPPPKAAPSASFFGQAPAAAPAAPQMPPAQFVAPPAQPAMPPPQPMAPPVSARVSTPSAPAQASTTLGSLDPQTSECLREVREMFNLSSENEALRMLVKIGFENVKDILPR